MTGKEAHEQNKDYIYTQMNKITFQKVVPSVFSERKDLVSDIWANDISFEKGHLYLVEADSGKGKSTFCSYVVAIATTTRATSSSTTTIP